MEELAKADIFFFITTIAVVLISLVFIIALVYIVSILRAIKRFTDRAESKAEDIYGDIDDFRAGVRRKAETASRVTSALSAAHVAKKIVNLFRGDSKKKRRARYREHEEDTDIDEENYQNNSGDRV